MELLADDAAEVVREPEIRATITRRFHGLVTPLQQPLRVGERAELLGVRGGRQQEHLGADVRGLELTALDLGRVVPERRRLDLVQVAHDQPVEARQRAPMQLRVRGADRRVLAEQKEAVHPPVDHAEHRLVCGVVARDARQVIEAEIVLLRGRVAPPRLQQAHGVGLHVAPVAGRRRVLMDELLEKISTQGMSALTDEERRFMKQFSDRYRNKH